MSVILWPWTAALENGLHVWNGEYGRCLLMIGYNNRVQTILDGNVDDVLPSVSFIHPQELTDPFHALDWILADKSARFQPWTCLNILKVVCVFISKNAVRTPVDRDQDWLVFANSLLRSTSTKPWSLIINDYLSWLTTINHDQPKSNI